MVIVSRTGMHEMLQLHRNSLMPLLLSMRVFQTSVEQCGLEGIPVSVYLLKMHHSKKVVKNRCMDN